MKTLSKSMILVLLCNTLVLSVVAQESNSGTATENYRNQPVWIDMMRDPKANYFETLRAFREYWDDRPLPREPFEAEEMESFEREVGLIRDGDSERDRERRNRRRWKRRSTEIEPDYAAEVRAFKGWMQTVKPWIREDGSIMTPEEQQLIIDRQQRELKAIERKNGK